MVIRSFVSQISHFRWVNLGYEAWINPSACTWFICLLLLIDFVLKFELENFPIQVFPENRSLPRTKILSLESRNNLVNPILA